MKSSKLKILLPVLVSVVLLASAGRAMAGSARDVDCFDENGERLFICAPQPSDTPRSETPQMVVSPCGNAVLEAEEECDDGNITSGDGCSANCQIESGWICTSTSPSVCTYRTKEPSVKANLPKPSNFTGKGGEVIVQSHGTRISPTPSKETSVYSIPRISVDGDTDGRQGDMQVDCNAILRQMSVVCTHGEGGNGGACDFYATIYIQACPGGQLPDTDR